MLRRIFILCFPFLLISCSAMPVDKYAHLSPKFDLMTFFSGHTKAWGQFQNRSGDLIRRFEVDIHGTVSDSPQGKQLVLEEYFLYDDGEKQHRQWVITETAPNQYEGKAGDVIGIAKGMSAGPVLNWRYTLDLPYKNDSLHVQFDDWMFLQTDKTMINRAEVTKWGFKVGEVTLFFQKDS